MKNILKNLHISRRSRGKIKEDNTVEEYNFVTYDYVSSPLKGHWTDSDWDEYLQKIENARLKRNRKEKLEKLNGILGNR